MEPVALKPISGYDESLYTALEQKKDYYPTLLEFASKNYPQIIANAQAFGTTYAIIYTVPEGSTLYLCSWTYTGNRDAVGAWTGQIALVGGTNYLFYTQNDAGGTEGVYHSLTYPMPLKLESGQQIGVYSTNADSIGFITGFLVPFS